MKKNTYSWQKEAETYFSYTPSPKVWFEILGWLTALSTFQFLVDKTHSILIQGLYWFSYLVLYNYIQRIIWTTKFQHYLPNKLSPNFKKGVTYLIDALIVAAAYYLVSAVSRDLTKLVSS